MNEQLDLWGGSAPPQDLDLQKQVAYVLDRHPKARDNDNVCYVMYLVEFWHLNESIAEWLVSMMDRAPSYETVARRRRELQRNRTADGILQPSESIQKRRRERDGAGPPGRRR